MRLRALVTDRQVHVFPRLVSRGGGEGGCGTIGIGMYLYLADNRKKKHLTSNFVEALIP